MGRSQTLSINTADETRFMAEHYVKYNGKLCEITEILYDLDDNPLYRLDTKQLVHSTSVEVVVISKEEPDVIY